MGIKSEDAEQPAGGSEKDIVSPSWQQLVQSWRTVLVADSMAPVLSAGTELVWLVSSYCFGVQIWFPPDVRQVYSV